LPQLPELEVEFFAIEAMGFERRLSLRAGRALFVNGVGLLQALRIIREFRPRVILGTGGYSSFAPLLGGAALGIPTLIHEGNLRPGWVNRLLAPLVDGVLLGFPDTARQLNANRTVVTGVPLRSSVRAARSVTPQEAKRLFGLDPQRPVLLVLGGSLGARALYEPLIRARGKFQRRGIQLLILAGRETERLRAQLRGEDPEDVVILEHTPKVGLAMRAADLAVSRAGASTLAELLALGVPSVVVPWPGAADGHQEANARWLARRGACCLLPQEELERTLLREVLGLLEDGERLAQLSRKSAQLARPEAHHHVMKEVEFYLHHGRRPRSLSLSLHRDRRGRHERLGLGASRGGPLSQRLGP